MWQVCNWFSAKRWDIKVQHFLDTNAKKSLDSRIDECEKLIEECRNMVGAQKQFINRYVDLLVLLYKLKRERGDEEGKCLTLSSGMRRIHESRMAGLQIYLEQKKDRKREGGTIT